MICCDELVVDELGARMCVLPDLHESDHDLRRLTDVAADRLRLIEQGVQQVVDLEDARYQGRVQMHARTSRLFGEIVLAYWLGGLFARVARIRARDRL